MKPYEQQLEIAQVLIDEIPDLGQIAIDLSDKLDSLPSNIRLNDQQVNLIYSIGYSIFQQGKLEEARSIFQLLLLYKPTDRKILDAFSICCKRIGDFENASVCFMLLFLLDPSELRHAQQFAECLVAMGQTDIAEKAIDVIMSSIESGAYTDELVLARAQILKSMISVENDIQRTRLQ